jgi:hypothetical protein
MNYANTCFSYIYRKNIIDIELKLQFKKNDSNYRMKHILQSAINKIVSSSNSNKKSLK